MEREAKIQNEEEGSWVRKWRYVVDDDWLTDVYWRSEMREELWENERNVGESLFSPCTALYANPTDRDLAFSKQVQHRLSVPMSSSLEPRLSRESFASLTSSGSSPQGPRTSS